MTRGVAAFIATGVAAALLLGLGVGFDVGAFVILALIIAVGLVAVRATSKAETGGVKPARCPRCGGLVSPNAPYCKHCNHVFEEDPEGSAP